MESIVVILPLSLAISLAVTMIVRRIANAVGALDRAASSRNIHKRSVPRLGGVGILAGIYGAVSLGLLIDPVRDVLAADWVRVAGLGAAGLVIAAIGCYDDLRGASPREKLVVQMLVALLLYRVGFQIEQVDNPFGETIQLGMLSFPVTILWIVGVSNAINLIDGLDGLAGGIAIAGAVAIFAIGTHAGDLVTMIIALAVIGSVFGFLVFNVNPASIFMGDTGSLFLGAVLAALAIQPRAPGSQDVALLAMIVVMAIPIADTFLAFARRVVRATPIFRADREHLHHRLLDLGLDQRQATIALWAGSAVLTVAGVHIACGQQWRSVVLLGILLASIVALKKIGMLEFASPAIASRRQRNRERFKVIRSAVSRIRAGGTISEIRDHLNATASVLDAAAVTLRLASDTPRPALTGAIATDTRTMCFGLDPARPDLGWIEVTWKDATGTLDRDTEIVFEVLCQAVTFALNRIATRRALVMALTPVEYNTPATAPHPAQHGIDRGDPHGIDMGGA